MSEPIIMPETLQPYHPENNPIGFIKEKSEYDKAYYKIMRNTALFLREKKLKEEAGEDVSNCVKLQKPYPQIPRISSIYEKKETTGTGSTDADSQGTDAGISDKQGADAEISDKQGADERVKDARSKDSRSGRNNSDAPGCIPTAPHSNATAPNPSLQTPNSSLPLCCIPNKLNTFLFYNCL